jgi:hypothetical protein
MIRRLFIASLALGLSACSPPASPPPKAPDEPVEVFSTPTAADGGSMEQLRSEYAAGQIFVVRLNPATLTGAPAGSNRTLSLSASVRLRSVTREVTKLDDGRVVWTGDIAGTAPLPAGDATLVVDGQSATGTITTPDGKTYQVRPIEGGATAVIELDYRKLPREEPEGHPGYAAPDGADAGPQASASVATAAATPVVDLLVVYTPAAATASGGIDSLIALAATETNKGFKNSKVNAQVRVVAKMRIDYNEAGKSYDKILQAFVGNAAVKTKRNQVKADVAVLIVKQPDYCGMANAIKATAATAYAMVHYSCATGYYSFGHEIGHLVGARHNEQVDPSNTPYPYGHGFVRSATPTPFRTIMGYACGGAGCDPRINHWSNPAVNYGGYPTGTVAKNNNARVWNERAPAVSAFK